MVRRLTPTFLCACLSTLVSACNRGAEPAASKPHPEADARVRALADAYLQGYFERYPDAKTLYGVPGAHHDQLPDNSFEALKAWHAKEDAWLADAKQIDPGAIAAAPLRATYAITREALEGSIGARVCRYELWTVNQFVNAWQVNYAASDRLHARAHCRAERRRGVGDRSLRDLSRTGDCLHAGTDRDLEGARRREADDGSASISKASTIACSRTAASRSRFCARRSAVGRTPAEGFSSSR